MKLDYFFMNIGCALALKICTEEYIQEKDYVTLGKDFIDFANKDLVEKWGETHRINPEDNMALINMSRKVYMGDWDDVVTKWFLQTKIITEYAVLVGMRESNTDCLLQYSVFKNTNKAKADANGRFGIPHKPGVCGTDICDFSCYVNDFIYINSFVCANKKGHITMQTFLNMTAKDTFVLLSAGFLFAGDYKYNIEEKDTGALNKLVSYYEKYGFKNINNYVGQYEEQVTMVWCDDKNKMTALMSLIQ